MRSKFRSTLVVCAVAMAFAAVATASASATVSGPEWLVKGTALAAGKTQAIKSTGMSGIELNQQAASWSCTSESGSGELIGGIPGTGAGTITLKGCAAAGHGVESCALSTSPSIEHKMVLGEITFAYKTVLVYPQGTEGEVLEAIVPAGIKNGANTFTNVTASGSGCGSINGHSGALSAKGTEIKEPAFDKHCGLLAKVGQIKAGAFATLASGGQATEGALSLPLTPIETGELYSPATKTLKEIKCEPELTIIGSAVDVSGLFKVETSPTAELFGWKV
jgi:hypothetical protein